MLTEITDGVKISVSVEYQPYYSNPVQSHFVFTYNITIENCSDHTVHLLRRHWHISDSNGEVRQIEGEGVVGQQPMLESGESHQYISGCNLKTTIGKMNGTYLMERVLDGKTFKVKIPEFTMIVPYKLN